MPFIFHKITNGPLPQLWSRHFTRSFFSPFTRSFFPLLRALLFPSADQGWGRWWKIFCNTPTILSLLSSKLIFFKSSSLEWTRSILIRAHYLFTTSFNGWFTMTNTKYVIETHEDSTYTVKLKTWLWNHLCENSLYLPNVRFLFVFPIIYQPFA